MGLVAFRWKGRFSVSLFSTLDVRLAPSVREGRLGLDAGDLAADVSLARPVFPPVGLMLYSDFGGVSLGKSDRTPVRLRQLVGRFRHPLVSCLCRDVEEGIRRER